MIKNENAKFLAHHIEIYRTKGQKMNRKLCIPSISLEIHVESWTDVEDLFKYNDNKEENLQSLVLHKN